MHRARSKRYYIKRINFMVEETHRTLLRKPLAGDYFESELKMGQWY
jgi:hypothetical protein